MKIPSKKEMDEKTQFTLLPNDDYELIISEVKEETQNKFQAVADPETGQVPQEDILRITLEIVGFKDGSAATDDEGESSVGRKIFFTGRPGSLGYKDGGTTPSITRCFLAYSLGVEVDDEFEIEDFQDLIGKTVFAEIIKHTTLKGRKTNRIARFITPRKIRREENVTKVIPTGEPPVEKINVDVKDDKIDPEEVFVE